MAIFGYARVSTDGQTLDAQVAALKAAGAVRVLRETASGAKTDQRRAKSGGLTTRVGNHTSRATRVTAEERRHARKSGADGEPCLDTHDAAYYRRADDATLESERAVI